MATGTLFISKLALPDEQSVAGALFQTLTQLGGAFGLAFTALITSNIESKSLSQGKSAEDAQVDGIRAAFYFCAATGFTAFIIAAIALRGMGTIGKEKKMERTMTRETIPSQAGEAAAEAGRGAAAEDVREKV